MHVLNQLNASESISIFFLIKHEIQERWGSGTPRPFQAIPGRFWRLKSLIEQEPVWARAYFSKKTV